jgi:uncharacterized protein
MSNKEEIREKINAELPFLKEKYGVRSIGIFGSFVRNEQKIGSDVDILVEFKESIGFFDFIRLENHLSHILGEKVDLISQKALKSAIKEDVLKELVYV